MPVQYGQKNWRASGTPIVLDADQSTFLFVRLPRFASISGIIVDENDVGLPEHEVAAFRNTRPPRLIARAQADDRGIYRIFGLEPGNYLVRTIGRQYEDGGYLPTFFRETQRVEEAGFVETYLDQDRPDIKVRPIPGKLFNISGSVDQLWTAANGDARLRRGPRNRHHYRRFSIPSSSAGAVRTLRRSTRRIAAAIRPWAPTWPSPWNMI